MGRIYILVIVLFVVAGISSLIIQLVARKISSARKQRILNNASRDSLTSPTNTDGINITKCEYCGNITYKDEPCKRCGWKNEDQ